LYGTGSGRAIINTTGTNQLNGILSLYRLIDSNLHEGTGPGAGLALGASGHGGGGYGGAGGDGGYDRNDTPGMSHHCAHQI
jgi:hypothetical protein